MATINLPDGFSATYTYSEVEGGWECPGEIFKGHETTGHHFKGRGPTKEAAVDDASAKAKKAFSLMTK